MIWVAMMGTVLVACGDKKEETKADALKVETERVSEGNSLFSTDYVGEVEASKSTVLSFASAGQVTNLYVSEGQRVTKGQVIATVDPTQAKNTLALSQATYSQAEDAYRRMKMLHDQQSLSEMDWVEVQSKLAQAKASLDIAKKTLDNCTLRSPCSGVVGNKAIEQGMMTLPARPICSILDISTVKVRVSVPEKEFAQMSSAMLVKDGGISITVDAIGHKAYRPTMMEKGVEADMTTHTYDVRLSVANPDGRLLPGMVANVKIPAMTSGEQEKFISVPIRAVQQSADGQHFVWTVKNGTAHRTFVSVGKTMGNRVAIVDGLQTGDYVITSGYQKVSEGTRVRYGI